MTLTDSEVMQMSSTYNHNISFSIFGESHGPAIGVVIDNLPSGEEIDTELISAFMARRAPKQDGTSTMRNETDKFEILSGLYNQKTTGTPLTAIIKNSDQHSSDYNNIQTLARPGHADYTGNIRYKGCNDIRGGGHFSGRLTAPLVFTGALCSQLLNKRNIFTCAHILKIHNIVDKTFNPVNTCIKDILKVQNKAFPVIDDNAGKNMFDEIQMARQNLDSIGGIVECISLNVPGGIGSPVFDGLENNIAKIMFSIPAVKGIEFGNGFEASSLFGSQNNDEFYYENNKVYTKTNNHGGILGGISSGMPITCRVAFKPTPSIAKEQNTINYKTLQNDKIIINGRHDPCVVPRAVPCVEAAVNIAILSELMSCPEFF